MSSVVEMIIYAPSSLSCKKPRIVLGFHKTTQQFVCHSGALSSNNEPCVFAFLLLRYVIHSDDDVAYIRTYVGIAIF